MFKLQGSLEQRRKNPEGRQANPTRMSYEGLAGKHQAFHNNSLGLIFYRKNENSI